MEQEVIICNMTKAMVIRPSGRYRDVPRLPVKLAKPVRQLLLVLAIFVLACTLYGVHLISTDKTLCYLTSSNFACSIFH